MRLSALECGCLCNPRKGEAEAVLVTLGDSVVRCVVTRLAAMCSACSPSLLLRARSNPLAASFFAIARGLFRGMVCVAVRASDQHHGNIRQHRLRWKAQNRCATCRAEPVCCMPSRTGGLHWQTDRPTVSSSFTLAACFLEMKECNREDVLDFEGR